MDPSKIPKSNNFRSPERQLHF